MGISWVNVVVLLALLEYVAFGVLVGSARVQYGVKAPSMSANEVVPSDRRVEIGHRQDNEHAQRDDLLDRLQLRRIVDAESIAVRRHLQAVFEERDTPADDYHQP